MPDREEPVFRDALFRQKRKHGAWREVEAPRLEGPVADTHAHMQMLADPALEFARCTLHGVRFVACVCDVCEGNDDALLFDGLDTWRAAVPQVLEELRAAAGAGDGCGDAPDAPDARIVVGCHPHNAKDFDAAAEARLRKRLRDPRACAIGEIGLDYHYDLSPRCAQREVFRRQLRIAHELGFPVVLHLREAHGDALRILRDEGCPQAGVLLHCFNLGSQQLQPFLQLGCYVAFGGPVTFKKADEVREAAQLVPMDKLLTETDSPYMTPEPMRGANCGPAHTVFTAARLAEVRGAEPGEDRARFLNALYENARALLDRPALPCQMAAEAHR